MLPSFDSYATKRQCQGNRIKSFATELDERAESFL